MSEELKTTLGLFCGLFFTAGLFTGFCAGGLFAFWLMRTDEQPKDEKEAKP